MFSKSYANFRPDRSEIANFSEKRALKIGYESGGHENSLASIIQAHDAAIIFTAAQRLSLKEFSTGKISAPTIGIGFT